MDITHNTTPHGHNVHDRCGRFWRNDADLVGRRPLYVHYRDLACPARSGGARIHYLGDPSRASVVPRRAQLGQLVALLATFLFGMSFAFQAHAATGIMFDTINETAGTSSSYGVAGIISQDCGTGITQQRPYGYQFEYATTSNVVIAELVAKFNGSVTSTSNLSWKNTDGQTGYGQAIPDTTTTYTLIPAANGNDITFTWSTVAPWPDNLSDGFTGVSAYTSLYPEISNQVLRCTTNGYISNVLPRNQFGVPPIQLIGVYNGSQTPEQQAADPGAQVPTSTWDGTFGGSIPGIGFENATGSYSASGTYATHINSMVGNATTTFPMCFAYPWFVFLDTIQAQTLHSQIAQKLTITGAGIVPTSTFTLEQFPDVAAKIGFQDPYNQLIAFGESMLWLAFGLIVFLQIFAPKNPPPTD